MIVVIDPGNTHSAYVVLDGTRLVRFAKLSNRAMLSELVGVAGEGCAECVVEMIASYGMPVGREVFETCVMIGRIEERWERLTGKAPHRITRHEVKIAMCNSARAKDQNIRAALIDLYGGKDRAVGRKACPGPLYGVSGDVWAALAVGRSYQAKKIFFQHPSNC